MFFGCFLRFLKVFSYVVHAHLEDVLGHLKSKMHAKEVVASLVCIKWC